MPRVSANGLAINYDQQGAGEPLVLIPYLAADHACYAFQMAEYAKHFTCISLDLRGTGESDKPDAAYRRETLADDVACQGFSGSDGLLQDVEYLMVGENFSDQLSGVVLFDGPTPIVLSITGRATRTP